MKIGKKIVSLFLVLLMLFTSVPVAFAAKDNTASAQTQTQLTAENGMANIINNLSASEQSEENSGFSIKDVIFEDNIAYVNINVAEKCNLVVAVYDEDTFEMLGSGTKTVEASTYTEDKTEDIQEVEVDINTMPDHYLAKAFLLDDSYNALCKEYVCRSYTTVYEVFMDTTPSDFPNSEIVAFDNSLDDFGVINDDAIVLDKDTSYTYENGVYTFNSADEKLASLKAGDIIYIPLSDEIGDFILIKVAAVEKKGTTVIVTDDEDIALGDAFQFVRIDEDADFTDVSVDEENLGSALEVIDEEEQEISTQSLERAEVDITKNSTFSTNLKVKYPKSKSEDKDAFEKGISISGTFGYELAASVKLYYDIRWGADFYEFKTELTHTVEINVKISGKIETNKDFFKIPISPIPIGIFMLYIDAYPVFSVGATITFEGTLEVYNNMSFSDSNDLTKTNETKWLDGDFDIGKTDIEIKFGVAIDFDLGYKVGKEDKKGLSKIHATVGAGFEGGIKGTFTPSLIGVLLDKHHDCVFCLTGSISMYLEGTATLKFKLVSKKLSWSWDAISLGASAKLGDCYFSISSNGAKFAFGTCENISYAVTVTVKDKDNKAVKDAIVSTTTGCCDADGDGKFKETSMKTNEDGQATFYFKKGKHILTAEKDGATGDSGTFQILSNAKSTTIKLGSSGGSTGGNTGGSTDEIISGSCGDNVTYTLNKTTGLLTISGTGKMRDYYGDSPFYSYRSYIKTVVIESGVTSIGDDAFRGCTSLISVTIPDSVTSIGDEAFWGCTGLTSVTIPGSVTSIGSYAFRGCTGLTSVTIPNSVTSIGSYAFRGCTGLTSITVDSNNTKYSSDSYGVLFNKDKTELIQYPIGNTRTSYTIPDSVTSIGDGAFWGCTGLTSVTIGNSVTSIGDHAFEGCTGLTSVTIPDSVTSIDDWAFEYCTGLTSVTIGNGVTSIGWSAFEGCTGLTSITIPDSVTSIGSSAFEDCTGLTSITIPDSVTSIGEWAFYGCTGLTSVTIPDSVTSIGGSAFYNCTGLTSITIPDSVTSIGEWAFYGCTGLTSVTIPDSVTSIGGSAFYNCTSLTSVTIPDSVTRIGNSAFRGCTGLTSVTIPDSVTSIGWSAFYGCTNLKTVYYTSTQDQWNSISIGSDNSCLKNANIVFNSTSRSTKSNNPTVASYAAPVALSTTPTVFSLRSATATKSATKSDVLKGSDYVLLVVKDPDSEDMLSSDNLLYIDQKTADSDTISFDYVLPTGTSVYTATIYGVTHTVADHTYSDWSTTKAPTCTQSGTAQRTCTACDQIETKTLDPAGHTFSGSLCTACGYDQANDCSCNCHKTGIVHFFFVIVNFFEKLFGNNKVCACGAEH